MTPDQARDLLDGTTPGPWVRRRDANGTPTPVVVSAGPTDRHHIMTADPAASPERQQADTALIAAAPALAAMRAEMHEEWAKEAWIPGSGEWHPIRWCRSRDEAERDDWMRSIPLGATVEYRIVRRYITNEEEA